METYGSPCLLQTYDTNRLIISDIPKFLIIDQPVDFTIDVSKAGKGEIEVAINNGQVKNHVKPLGKSKFHFTFIPKLNEPHSISITFNGHQVVGFPKQCSIITSDNVKFRGPSLRPVLLGLETWFTIDITYSDLSDLHVTIFTPSNDKLNPSTLLTSDGLRVDWTPMEIGIYRIHLTLFGFSLPGSPLTMKCYDPKKVIIKPPLRDSMIRIPTRFIIDASKAGEGDLAISVNHSGRNIPNEINPIGNGRLEIQFTPQKAVTHYCNILFNHEHVPGSPLAVNVMETQRVIAIGKGLGSVPINIPTSFTVHTPNDSTGQLKCLIKGGVNDIFCYDLKDVKNFAGSDDRLISCLITKIDLNRYEVTYTTDRVGEFYIEIFYDNIQIDSSPFLVRSFDANQIKILHFPSSAIAGSSTSFIIDATDSGAGSLEIAISRNGKNIPNYVQNEGTARFRIKFIPDQPCIHQVQIKFNGTDIHGSPYLCNVISSEFIFENYEYAPIHKRTSFSIKPKSNFNSNIYFDIKNSAGNDIKGKLEKISMNSFAIDFIPNEIGDHEIRFYNDEDKKFIMTKFICQVYDPSKIRVSDLPLAIARQPYKFTLHTADAGHGVLSVKIKQNGDKLSHELTQISTYIYQISFTPETEDECIVQISFNGENNFRTLVIPVRNDCEQVHVSSIPSGVIDRPVTFTIDGADSDLVSILVTESQSNRIVSHTMTPISNDKNNYEISFIPTAARQHIVSISYDGKLLSTHHVDVCNVNKIHVSSIRDGIVGASSIFSVDTQGAGEGHLEVTISNGQRTLPAELKSIQARKFDIAFVPEMSGIHSIDLAFNGVSIEGSPFTINVADPLTSDNSASEVDDNDDDDDDDDYEFLIGGELQGTKVGEVAWVICETSITDIYEDFNIYVTDPHKIIVKHSRIQDSFGRWRIEYEPTEEGIYQIQIDSNKSPINLAVMDVLPADYERTVFGERIVYPNSLNFISIMSNNKNIKVQLRSSNNIEVPIEIERHGLEWKISYSLTAIGTYQLTIIDEDDQQLYDLFCITETIDLFRNGGIEDITKIIIDHKKVFADDVNVIVKDPLAHTIPAAFYRNSNRDLVIEYIPVRADIHEVFIRTQNKVLDVCPIRIMAFTAQQPYDPVPRVQIKEILEHTFEGVIDENNKLEICVTDPFERPIPFQRSKNEHGELTLSLSPVRIGTHWICMSNDDNDSFAVLPIFAFDDDYVPLSPLDTPSPNDRTLRDENNTNNNNNSNSVSDLFSPVKELTTISEISEFQSSRLSSISPARLTSSIKEAVTNTAPPDAHESSSTPTCNDRSSPQVQILDINDLIDPCVRTISRFTFKDPNNKFNIAIYDANRDEIAYHAEHLSDGRKRISYQPTIVGHVEIHILEDNELITDNPLIVYAFDPSAVHLINFPKKIQINTTHEFHIDPTQAGKGTLKIMIKDPNNQHVPIHVEKQSSCYITVQFKPTIAGPHTVSILFNRIPISRTPSQIIVENVEQIQIVRLPELEERGRSIYSKHELFLLAQQQDRPHALPSQVFRTLLSKSNEVLSRKKDSSATKHHGNEQIIRSEETHQTKIQSIPLNETEIQRLQSLKEKFDRGQPIDIIFNPRLYPFKILLQNAYPLVDTDVHFLVDHPHVAYVHITINGMKVPLLATRQHNDTFLLKFRPTIAGDYLITLKDFLGQHILGCPVNFPVYNPNGVHLEPFHPLQAINDCHFICTLLFTPIEFITHTLILLLGNVDNVGQGKFFVMIYNQLKPIQIPCQLQSLTKNRCRISFSPSKIGTYRIYLAYRNIPINGM
ncbi:unnamed protein product [Rotaria socialis]|uniref:Uncharacterized protein n=1 Tax=Rotaria socialis TaxID=392032 RepID=A0A817Y9W9_9BILA|nr:unnamed protein product [Rotaria socialis]